MSSMFQHILVPLDFSDKSQHAAEVAAQLAAQNGARVTLLHVIETIEYAPDEEVAQFYDMLKEKAETQLMEMAQPFETRDLQVDRRIVLGKRARDIVTQSMQQDIDLIVLASHKVNLENGPQEWSTLSYQVSVACQCAVLLVK